MPTIRVDAEVYAWLQSQATPFEDNPNSVLRRVSGLDPEEQTLDLFGPGNGSQDQNRKITGRFLNEEWGVGAEHALYHCDGTFFENLARFPGALFDATGYVVFENEEEYRNHPALQIGEKLNVPEGINSLPSYVRVRI